MDFLRQRLCNIVLLLKIKSRIFKDVCTFTADAIEILQYDGAIPSEKISIEPEVHLEQDNDKVIRAKIAAKAKRQGENTIGSSFKDSLSSDDDKPISEIFRGKKKICSIVLSEDSSNDSLNCVVESVERGNIGKIKRRFVSKRKKVVHLDLSEDSDDVDTPENFDDAHLDMPLSDELVGRATDCKLVEDSHMESCLPLAGKRVPQTPTLKSRSGRTIKRRILD
ncbi:uncharacterized protein LOC131004560 [Salvia miltiorrhiza]|uniref:uncharacterized protein LOC131004560 n=1 Tax=Salvia miltiorrhiza TaxID=226208 RepID=UPI0025ACAB95|nr:uncharacterized protein LOC131004560 [Salvia miltiorrhiza]